MTVTLELEPELEHGLQAQAQARGVTIEYLIHDLVSRQVGVVDPFEATKRALELPAWDLGDMGPLHRRDIYDEDR